MTDWRVRPDRDRAADESDVEAVLDTLRSGWLTMGPRTQELEARLRGVRRHGARGRGFERERGPPPCLRRAGVGPGDEVIAPGLSFVADAHAGRLAGGSTVLVDCASLSEPLIDPAEVERRITERTKAVIAVHMFGYPADVDALLAICDDADIALIEDCAEADGGRLRDGAMAGTAGICGCFSFFSKTQLGVGEGGIIVTDDEEFAGRVRALRSHAMTSVTWDRHRGHAETYDVTDLGFNYRIDEPRAALAQSRLEPSRRRAGGAAPRRRAATASGSRRSTGSRCRSRTSGSSSPGTSHSRCWSPTARPATRCARRCTPRGVQTTFYPALTQLSAYEPAAGEEGFPSPRSSQIGIWRCRCRLASTRRRSTPSIAELEGALGKLR